MARCDIGNQQGLSPTCAGEPTSIPLICRLSAGLAPRVRGAVGVSFRWRPLWGLSPRVRGSPHDRRIRSLVRRVYPRVCGGASVKYLTKVRLSSVFSCQ